jgi:hypothetical protein
MILEAGPDLDESIVLAELQVGSFLPVGGMSSTSTVLNDMANAEVGMPATRTEAHTAPAHEGQKGGEGRWIAATTSSAMVIVVRMARLR